MVDANPFVSGDSSKSAKMAKLADDLLDLATGKKPFTLILGECIIPYKFGVENACFTLVLPVVANFLIFIVKVLIA